MNYRNMIQSIKCVILYIKEEMRKMADRLRSLLKSMSLDEKLRQMLMYNSPKELLDGCTFSKEKADKIFNGKGYGILWISSLSFLSPEQLFDFICDLQKYLKSNTSSGIPALIGAEGLHGVLFPGMTVFPQNIGLACAWDTALTEEIADSISQEAESVGITQLLSPVLDLAREPRWGRTEETYGEDSWLAACLGKAYTTGIRKRQKVAATLKHFVAHGEPENGINLSPVNTGERKLRELYLPPFEACLMADPLSVMPAYHEIDGKPCHASKKLLNGILREELGFNGYTISDFGGISMLHSFHKTAGSKAEAGKQALLAGIDLEASSEYGFGETLRNLVESGEISLADIDRAVGRILYVKERLGLLKKNYMPIRIKAEREHHRKLSLRAAEESIVLLKNSGLLPLSDNISTIALVGPNANAVQLGDYCAERSGVSLLDGLSKYYHGRINYACGCTIFGSIPHGIEDAVQVVRSSDVVILALGGSSMTKGGIGWGENDIAETTSGEGYDCYDLRLPPVQLALADSIIAEGKPVILILQDGRPCAIPEIYERCAAVVQAWYPGEEGGTALAKILIGAVNPSGKLSISIPAHVGQLPVFYNHKPSCRGVFYNSYGTRGKPGRAYTLLDPHPYYSFGFGLSYTQFLYKNLIITVTEKAEITVSVDVENTGAVYGKEIVQLYINDRVSSVTTPVKALKGFKKISLLPGEAETVRFYIGFAELYLIDDNMKKTVEPGWFDVMISDLKGSFYLTEEQCKALG